MPQKIRFVVEGDSWHCLPNISISKGGFPIVGGSNSDISRALAGLGHEVENIAHWGDRIDEIVREKSYLSALSAARADIFLLCGGGNDLLHGGRLKEDLRLFLPGRPPAEYLKRSFRAIMEKCLACYEQIFEDLQDGPATRHIPVLCHAYAHPVPTLNGHWLGDPMRFMGIHDQALQTAIAREMIDQYNKALAGLVRRHPNVHFVDLRPIINGRWHDELHPTRAAFADAATKIVAKARRLLR